MRLLLLPHLDPHDQARIYYYRCIGLTTTATSAGASATAARSAPTNSTSSSGQRSGDCSRTPSCVRAEIDRRLKALRTEHPAARRREALERDLTRAAGAIERLIEAYQEQLISLDELRARMPALRKRQSTLQAQLDALEDELHDAETYLKLADTLEGFLTRLSDGLDQLTLDEQQRILRLIVREVLIGGDEDKITIRHSIPTPNGGPNGSYPLRGSSHRRPLRGALLDRGHDPALEHPCPQPTPEQLQHRPIAHPPLDLSDQRVVGSISSKQLRMSASSAHCFPRQVAVVRTVSSAW